MATRIRHIARRIEDPTLRHQFLENLRKHVPGL